MALGLCGRPPELGLGVHLMITPVTRRGVCSGCLCNVPRSDDLKGLVLIRPRRPYISHFRGAGCGDRR